MLKNLKKNKEITEDEQKVYEEDVQKLTDKYIKLIDQATENKEKELMEI